MVFHVCWLNMATKNDPRPSQDGSPTDSEICFFVTYICFDFCPILFVSGTVVMSFWLPFGTRFGANIDQEFELKSKDRPKRFRETPKKPQEAPKRDPQAPKSTHKAVKGHPRAFKRHPKSTQEHIKVFPLCVSGPVRSRLAR